MNAALRYLSRGAVLRRTLSTHSDVLDSLKCSSSLHTAADLFINGQFVKSKSSSTMDVLNPANTQQVVNTVPEITSDEFSLAVSNAKEACAGWAATPIPERQRIMFKFLAKIHQYKDDLAKIVTLENGKTLSDAHGDVFRGLEVCTPLINTHVIIKVWHPCLAWAC